MLAQKKSHFVRFIALVVVVAMALFAVACTAENGPSGAAPVANSNGGITVVGQGEAFGTPDHAQIQAGVETFAETVAAATSENEATIQAIMAALGEMGIPEEAIQTSNYSLWAEQIYGDRGPEGIAGYRVSNLVTVKIDDIDSVGNVIAAVTEAGANNIHGVSFSVADPAALEAEARESAIANARAKATSLADLSNVTLGEVVAISEVIGSPTPLPRGMGGAVMESAAAAPSISPGELSVQVQVQVTFAIQ
jgi:uncharacterized protein YggE